MNDTPEGTSIPAPGQATAGQLLRQARLGAGVHLGILSAALKVPVKTLEQLEADQLEGLGAPAFVRALAGSVCRQLHTDPQPILARLPQSGSQLKPAPGALGGDDRRFGTTPSSKGFPRLRWREPLLWLGVAMLAIIAVLIWRPDLVQSAMGSTSYSEPSVKTDAQVTTSALPPEPASGVVMGQATDLVSTPEGAAPVSAAPPAALSTVSTQPPSVPAADVPKTVPGPQTLLMGVVARADSWVEVRDANGQVLLSKLMKSGDRETITHGQALRVVIGRADAVSVEVKGKPFDLKPHTQVTVARFEVQP